jgi:hypothetical protein
MIDVRILKLAAKYNTDPRFKSKIDIDFKAGTFTVIDKTADELKHQQNLKQQEKARKRKESEAVKKIEDEINKRLAKGQSTFDNPEFWEGGVVPDFGYMEMLEAERKKDLRRARRKRPKNDPVDVSQFLVAEETSKIENFEEDRAQKDATKHSSAEDPRKVGQEDEPNQ